MLRSSSLLSIRRAPGSEWAVQSVLAGTSRQTSQGVTNRLMWRRSAAEPNQSLKARDGCTLKRRRHCNYGANEPRLILTCGLLSQWVVCALLALCCTEKKAILSFWKLQTHEIGGFSAREEPTPHRSQDRDEAWFISWIGLLGQWTAVSAMWKRGRKPGPREPLWGSQCHGSARVPPWITGDREWAYQRQMLQWTTRLHAPRWGQRVAALVAEPLVADESCGSNAVLGRPAAADWHGDADR